MKRIGILGGTFDPIHNGHLFLAKTVSEHFALDEIWFLPLNVPPHKEQPAASPQKRTALIEKVIRPYPAYHLCDVELKRPGVTYTVDTLRQLHEKEAARFFYIIGSDTLLDLPNWKSYHTVLSLCGFICVPRIGADKPDGVLSRLRQEGADISLLNQAAPDISSSMIKERLKSGLSIEALVPEPILKEVLRLYSF